MTLLRVHSSRWLGAAAVPITVTPSGRTCVRVHLHFDFATLRIRAADAPMGSYRLGPNPLPKFLEKDTAKLNAALTQK